MSRIACAAFRQWCVRVVVIGFTLVVGGASGCGTIARPQAGATTSSDTLFSTVAGDDYGYEIVAAKSDDLAGEWTFALKSQRPPKDNNLRFEWKIDGQAYQGPAVTHVFTQAGTYVISVRAIEPNGNEVFVLTLELQIELPPPPNQAPVAVVQAVSKDGRVIDREGGEGEQVWGVYENEQVFLDGSESYDPDGDDISFKWAQVTGDASHFVQLVDASAAVASFVAPTVDGDVRVAFTLTVSDGRRGTDVTVPVDVLDIIEVLDNCPDDPDKTDPGQCGCGNPDTDSDEDGTADCVDDCPSDPTKTTPGECGCGIADGDLNGNGIPDCNEVSDCLTSTPTWQNASFPGRGGVFTVRFDATPNDANMDGLVGLSYGKTSTFADSAVTVRFDVDGFIDAWNPEGTKPWDPTTPGWYSADTVLEYTLGELYHFRLEVNVAQHIYSVYVAPHGLAEHTIAQGYGFRQPQGPDPVSVLDYWSIWAGIGSHNVCDFRVGDCSVDSDGDGLMDCEDGCPNDPNKSSPGVCGCGNADTDSDGDGTADCNDGCPNDPGKTAPGICGCATPDTDSDGDGTADCVDVCPGSDDRIDSDGDGIPDGCDPCQSNAECDDGNVCTDDACVAGACQHTNNTAPCDDGLFCTATDTCSGGVCAGSGDRCPGQECNETSDACYDPGAFLPMSTASRTSGVAPLAVFFDAVDVDGWVSGVVQPPLVNGRREYADLHYQWNFGDDPAAMWATSGKSKNEATGYVTAHVFEDPGTYTVTLHVINTNGDTHDYSQDITVSPFTGTTYYVSATGSDTNSGLSEQAPFRTFGKAVSMIAPNVRILFRRGDTFSTSSGAHISVTGPGLIGAYGDCLGPDGRGICSNNPVINVASGVHGISFAGSVAPRNWRIMDIELAGPGSGSNEQGITAGGTHRDWLLLRSHIHGFYRAVLIAPWFTGSGSSYDSSTMHDHLVLADCDLHDTVANTVFYGGRRLALIGSSVHDGHHLIRVWHGSKSVIGNNVIYDSAEGAHALKFHNTKNVDGLPDGQYVVITDNRFRGPGWVVTIGPQNDTSYEIVKNVLVERNIIDPDARGEVGFKISAQNVTLRNNVANGEGYPWRFHLSGVSRRGIEPPPTGARIYNNTVYRNDSGDVGIIQAFLLDTQVVNNLAYTRSGSASEGGEGAQFISNLTMVGDPLWNGDWHLQAGSDAIDAGALVPVFDDLDGERRPSGPALDIGADESAP